MQEKVWGVAYRVPDSVVGEGKHLDQREQKYTQRLRLPVYTKNGKTFIEDALVFMGTDDQKLQLGPHPLAEMAAQIVNAYGPSGPNHQYLFELAHFLRTETDESENSEVFQLEKAVKSMLLNKE